MKTLWTVYPSLIRRRTISIVAQIDGRRTRQERQGWSCSAIISKSIQHRIGIRNDRPSTITIKLHQGICNSDYAGIELVNGTTLYRGGNITLAEVKDPAAFKKQVKAAFFGSGELERPEANLNAAAELKKNGINAVGYVSPRTAHEFLTWRRCLYEFAPRLFR